MAVDIGGMRTPYRSVKDTFDVTDLVYCTFFGIHIAHFKKMRVFFSRVDEA